MLIMCLQNMTSQAGMYMNVCTPLFRSLYDWSEENENLNEGLMNTLFCVGTIFGTSFCGKTMSTSRNRAFIISGIVGLVGSLLTFYINWYVFLIAKFICGFNYGMVGVVVARMIEEYVPTAYYGFCAAIGIAAIQLGTLVGSLAGLVLPPDEDKEALAATKNYYIIYAVQPVL
jgi:MFS family permease